MSTEKAPVKKNAFGMPVYPIQEILADKTVEHMARKELTHMFAQFDVPSPRIPSMVSDTFQLAKHLPEPNYEMMIYTMLRNKNLFDLIPGRLEARSKLIASQVSPYLQDGNVLDLGCGSGRVGQLLSYQNRKVSLADVYVSPHVSGTGLEFRLFDQGQTVPFPEGHSNNTLVLTVFHHSDDPVKLIKEAARVTKPKGNVIVIESVYGVDGKDLPQSQRVEISDYLSLDAERQRKLNMFFDHFYNRIIFFGPHPEDKVNVPFNFNTPDGWKALFENEGGMRQINLIHLGVDQKTVPEYHTLHVLRRT